MTDEKRPLLRDRSRFFHHLLNGDQDSYQRVAPAWREQRRTARAARRVRTTDLSDNELRDLKKRMSQERKVKKACRRLLRSLRTARRRIKKAGRKRAHDEAARMAVAEDAREIAQRIGAVRNHVVAVNQVAKASPFAAAEVQRLEIEFVVEGDHKTRNLKYQQALTALDKVERTALALRRDAVSRKRALKREQKRRFD